MESYDPNVAPDPDEWNELDEGEQLLLVHQYHEDEGIDIPGFEVHMALHVAVENQVAMGDDHPASAALERVMRDAPSRHDALHALASVLAEHMWSMAQDSKGGNSYERELRNLTWVRFLRSLD
jgi:hypothetical protein